MFEPILRQSLPDLADDTILNYLVGMLEDASLDEIESLEYYCDTIGPFLQSMEIASSEAESNNMCARIYSAFTSSKAVISEKEKDRLDNENSKIKKLDKMTKMDDHVHTDQDTALIDKMWGLDRIRAQVNEKVDCKVAVSQRQIRKQIRVDRALEVREEKEAQEDLEWENTRILPDANAVNTGERDIHVPSVTISFKGLSLVLDSPLKLISGRKYGLIGNNGTGKTTLLRYIAKYEIEGFPKHVRIQSVEQESAEKLSLVKKSVLQVVMEADYERQALLDREKILLEKKDDASQDELADIYNALAEIGSDSVEARARSILTGLQFSPTMIDGPTTDLSGGWRMRAALAGALFMTPDLLLLDEPTNHLDLEAVMWLETYLETYESTLVVVSHDRNFLDSVITDVIHLHRQKLIYYKGDYATFEQVRKETLRQQRKAYDAQQAKIAHMQEFIDRFRSNAKKAPLVQSRVKAIEKMELIEEPEDDQAFRMQFPPPDPLGRPIISITDVAFRYEVKKSDALPTSDTEEKIYKQDSTLLPPIFEKVNFSIDMTSRIGILGKNGSGKSTLINLVLGKLRPTDGHIHCNPRLRIASFTQHHVDQLNLAKTAVENMMLLYPGHESLEFRKHLGRFNVSGNMAIKPTRKLSGGQKSRVAFAILTWNLPHVIVMDEPTNHLDIETIDALIDALNAFGGGVVIVSHDQHFVGSVCKELWQVHNGCVEVFRGNMNDYKKQILH